MSRLSTMSIDELSCLRERYGRLWDAGARAERWDWCESVMKRSRLLSAEIARRVA